MDDPKNIGFLDWKPPKYDHRRVFRAALLAAKRYQKKVELYKRSPDSNLAGKVIMFQMRGTGGSVIEKYLQIYGCPDIVNIDREDHLFDVITSIPVHGMLFWYASDARKSVDVLHRLHANRQLPRRPVMILYPGEEALTSLQSIDTPLLYDSAEPIPYSRLEFANKLEQWFAKADDDLDPRTALYRVRKSIRALAKKVGPGSLDEQQLVDQLQVLSQFQTGSFWIDVELTAFYLATGELDKCAHRVDQLVEKFGGVSLIPLILRANLSAAQGRDKAAGDQLINSIGDRELTDDQMLQVGRNLVRWRDVEPLKHFLNYWDQKAGFDRGYAYSYLVAMYYKRQRDLSTSYDFLKHTLAKAPFRWEFISAIAENRTMAKDYRMAEHYWVVARHHPYADSLSWAIGLIRSHYGQKRIRYADGLLAKMLKKYPNDPRLLKLKEIYVDERLDKIS